MSELVGDPPAARARSSPLAATAVAILLPVVAFGLYSVLGSPDAVEGERAFTMAAGGVSAETAPSFRDELARHLRAHPDDGRAWALLGRMELSMDRFERSAEAFARALAASRKVAMDPGVWCDYADALGMSQGGKLAGRPADLIVRALAIDPKHPRALEMAGSLAYEQGDFAEAADRWRELLALLPDDATQRRELLAAIARAERFALPAGVVAGANGS
jgi:cytochrome c-type biogenesis protein CcmH